MRKILLCAALAATALAPAFADELVARQGNDSVRLAEQPCTSEQVLGQLPTGLREDYKAASATVDGRSYRACWRPMGGAAHLLYEDGDQGLIPLSDLKPELAA
ncbi:hypothetical protein [Ramlibacter sp.]|uniref:hypothetical protein n=1 Tax=Ramlibacter sp. TaxID=1917967 RepID=UPI003D09E904